MLGERYNNVLVRSMTVLSMYSTSVKDAGMRPRGAGNLKVIDIK